MREAVAFLFDKGIGGAPVIDDAGRPVGVLTQTDIRPHDRERVDSITPASAAYEEFEDDEDLRQSLVERFQRLGMTVTGAPEGRHEQPRE